MYKFTANLMLIPALIIIFNPSDLSLIKRFGRNIFYFRLLIEAVPESNKHENAVTRK